MAHFTYLPKVIPEFDKRKALSFRLGNAMGTDFYQEALQQTLTRCGATWIISPDWGREFTAGEFGQPQDSRYVRASKDSKGRCIEDVFVEGLPAPAASPDWRAVTYGETPLHSYHAVWQVAVALSRCDGFYKARRPHQALQYRMPDRTYFRTDEMKKATYDEARVSQRVVCACETSYVCRCRELRTTRQSLTSALCLAMTVKPLLSRRV